MSKEPQSGNAHIERSESPRDSDVAARRKRRARFDPADTTAFTTSATEQRRRLHAIACGFTGDTSGARALLGDASERVRASALAALTRLGAITLDEAQLLLHDPSPLVRRALCELALRLPLVDFASLLEDEDPRVVEACAFCVGELELITAVPVLITVASGHADPLCRESAVAALGVIGDPAATATLIAALDDVATVRRRALIALSNFSGVEVETAMRAHLTDRDWQVRQAAEDLLGISAQERQ